MESGVISTLTWALFEAFASANTGGQSFSPMGSAESLLTSYPVAASAETTAIDATIFFLSSGLPCFGLILSILPILYANGVYFDQLRRF